MTTAQHPSDVDLLEFAAGKLIDREQTAVAEHANDCENCREFIHAMERVGGILLERLPPTVMASDSLSEVLARIEQPNLSPGLVPGSSSVSGPSSSGRWFGGSGAPARRRRLLQALPIAAAIALSVGITYLLVGSPVSPPISVPPGFKIVSISGEYQHPVPVGVLQIGERPGYVAPNDDTRPLAYERQPVFFLTNEPPGTLIINTSKNFIYLVLGNNRALRYAIGVARDCFQWQGLTKVSRKTEWPEWTPSPEALLRQPDWPRSMPGGPGNPLGARAIYLDEAGYRIHGTNEPEKIGNVVLSGCFHLENSDIIDLYQRVPIGARVIVQQAPVV
ncbi:MAG: L,D-transpeptidase family protein [Rhodoplanes sp.]